MKVTKSARLLFSALGATLVAMLAFGVSVAGATTTPSSAFTWPEQGAGGTGSTVLAVVLPLGLMLAATIYSIVALRHARTPSEAGALYSLPSREERKEERRAA